ncbi:C4b-binding protein beta chain isoform X1 [Cavia porcellus]|uniref:Complement component 4 binding protein beta n=1 Tax=Cavia porcellus TaxID=10141 RepID=H0UTS9_CAVPO|nr:C4b-binding protein beta chain [Cavia porcellus]XP_013013554.1 C4b-binding protein beta chain [Cavia porcellus]
MFCWIVSCLVFGWLTSASDAQSHPEIPSVKNSISIAEVVEGQIRGTYTCIQGYHLEGKKVFFSNASEEWDASTTQCRLGHCPDPVLENGEFSSSGPVNVNDIIAFKCNDHYILKGSSWSQCLEDHSWASPFPICKSRDCDPPEKPAHGYFQGANFTSGSMVTYHCESRYRLVGTPKQQCVDGEWSGAPPVCELIPRSGFEEALLAFQENTDLCSAIENFVRRVKENGLTMEELKYSLEIEKAELMQKLLT